METIISFALGSLASWLQTQDKTEMSSTTRFTLSIGACVLMGLVSTVPTVLKEGFEIDSLLKNIGTSFMASQVMYRTYFKRK